MKRLAPIAVALAVVAACGTQRGEAERNASRLTVYAAASLTRVLPQLDRNPQYQFAGSNTLALQIAQGAPADVFVSASPKYVLDLQAKGLLLGRPAWILSNRIVLIVPRRNPARITTPADLTRPGIRLVVAAVGVPAGDYARKSLAGMHLDAALQNVVSNEPDVEGVVAKVVSGDADAGFVYASDYHAVASKVRKIPLPGAGRYTAVYGAAALKRSTDPQLARGFVALLQSPIAQKQFLAAGFGLPPKAKAKPKRLG
jgi:molybdate transport system substrate-binding protein